MPQNHLRIGPDASTTLGLTAEHARALLTTASAHSLPMQPMVALLLLDGPRISEALAVPHPSAQGHTQAGNADVSTHLATKRTIAGGGPDPGPEAEQRPVAPFDPRQPGLSGGQTIGSGAETRPPAMGR